MSICRQGQSASRVIVAGLAVWAASAAIGASAAQGQESPDRKPNILFIFTDDQRADTIAALGNPIIKTPALDSLARRGFVFSNAYCLGSNYPAVCLPSRNMLLSGRTYFRWEGPQAPADQPNLPVTLRQAGYVTYHHGKKGNTALKIQEKFDVNKYVADDADRRSEPALTIVNEAIDFLKNRKDDRPFLMYLALGNPHDPRVAPQSYLDLYEGDRIPLPKNFLPVHPFNNGEMVIRDELLAGWPRTEGEIRRHLHEYYAVITAMDHQIGRLLGVLGDLGLEKDTIVIFSSDNGLAVGSHGLMGKQSLYEHSTKVPLLFAGPGIPQGRSDALAYLLDVFPTICQLAGVDVPAGLDGLGLKAVIEGRQEKVRNHAVFAYRDLQRAIRGSRFKLIRYPKIGKTQLFDLRSDPDELRDLSGDARYQERQERLMRRLAEELRRLGDEAPLTVEPPEDPTFTPPTGEALEKLLAPFKAN